MRALAATLVLALASVAVADSLGARLLRYGDSGPDVAQLQADLRLAGCDPGEDEGRFTPKTERSVRSFQEAAGLAVTGVVDSATLFALRAAREASPQETAESDDDLPPPPAGWTRGVDVSKYDAFIDWAAVASSKIRFAIARASDGLEADPFFERNWTRMKAAGLLRGAAQYFRASLDPVRQADLLAARMGAVGNGDFPPFLTVSTLDGASPSAVAASVNRWIAEIKARTGETPIVATTKALWDSLGDAAPRGCGLWIVQRGGSAPALPRAWSDWRFWQYTTSGQVSGINGAVDLDYFHGTGTDLAALAHGPQDPPTLTGSDDGYAGSPDTTNAACPTTDPLASNGTPANPGTARTPAPSTPSAMPSSTGQTPMPSPAAAPSAGGGASPGGGSAAPSMPSWLNNPSLGIAPALDGCKPASSGPVSEFKGEMTPELKETLRKAAEAAGLPASWADSDALKQILAHESSFNPKAQNPTSTAYGLFQFLNSTWKTVGMQKTSDPYLQSVAGLKYIAQRYGTPEKAWAFWQAHHWY